MKCRFCLLKDKISENEGFCHYLGEIVNLDNESCNQFKQDSNEGEENEFRTGN